MSEIKPALTPKEWAALSRHGVRAQASIGDPKAGRMYSPGYHGVAAAALHAHSFGFTWADVDRLRALLLLGDGDRRPISDSEIEAARSVIDRIAALLPPRAEGES